jgi:hypothetical protein
MAQFILPKEIIAHIISFAPIVSPHSICIKQAIQRYEEEHDEEDAEILFAEFTLWHNYFDKNPFPISGTNEFIPGIYWKGKFWVDYNGEYGLITKLLYDIIMNYLNMK